MKNITLNGYVYVIDEKSPIKKRDWVLNDDEIGKCDIIKPRIGYRCKDNTAVLCGTFCTPYKIISTNDPILVKDGIPLYSTQ